MTTPHDPELEGFRRTIDLVGYAKAAGYVPRPEPLGHGITVLDHPDRGCIAVARKADGIWIYASVNDYPPRAPHEPEAHATARLRACIQFARDKGTIVEFVERQDARALESERPLERVRERLRAFRATGVALDVEERRPPPSRDVDRAPVPAPRNDRHPTESEGLQVRRAPELGQRRYDWSPPIPKVQEREVDQRLRQGREAQANIDDRRRDLSGPGTPMAPTRDERALPGSPKSELNRRRYDWTPAPQGVDVTLRKRGGGPSSGRER
jgi:hypothetical protein